MKSIKFGSIAIVASTIILLFLKTAGAINCTWLECFAPVLLAIIGAVITFIAINILIAVMDKLDPH